MLAVLIYEKNADRTANSGRSMDTFKNCYIWQVCLGSFLIERGCHQGDLIACYLFIISIEFLANRLRADIDIKGFQFEGFSHLLEIYADDMTCFLTPKAKCLRKVIEILESFHKISGLKISVSKTKAL